MLYSVVDGLAGVSGTEGLVAVSAVMSVNVPGINAACNAPADATQDAEAEEKAAALTSLIESAFYAGFL